MSESESEIERDRDPSTSCLRREQLIRLSHDYVASGYRSCPPRPLSFFLSLSLRLYPSHLFLLHAQPPCFPRTLQWLLWRVRGGVLHPLLTLSLSLSLGRTGTGGFATGTASANLELPAVCVHHAGCLSVCLSVALSWHMLDVLPRTSSSSRTSPRYCSPTRVRRTTLHVIPSAPNCPLNPSSLPAPPSSPTPCIDDSRTSPRSRISRVHPPPPCQPEHSRLPPFSVSAKLRAPSSSVLHWRCWIAISLQSPRGPAPQFGPLRLRNISPQRLTCSRA